MGRDILKNIGSIIPLLGGVDTKRTGWSLLIILSLAWCELHATEITTKLSPSMIGVGQSAALTISVSGKSSVKPAKLPTINGLKITYLGASHSFQYVNGKTWSGTVLNFSIHGEKTGEYKIPPLILDTKEGQISSEEKILTVRESSVSGSNSPTKAEISLSSNTVYVGEPLIMRYYISGDSFDNIKVLGLAEQPLSKDFSIKKINENIDKDDKIHVASFYVVPLKNGDYNIGENSIHIQSEDINSFFSRYVKKTIPCQSKKINVLPLPAKGKTDNFTGDVGEYKIEVQTPAGEFKQFEEIKIPVKITGKGNLITLSKPKIENDDEQKIIIEEKEPLVSFNEDGLSGEKEYLVTIIPQKGGALNIGKIFIEYFNPYKKSYERAESQPLTFNILPIEKSSEADEISFDSTDNANQYRIFLFGKLFLFILSLAAFIISLIIWEKKKLNIIKNEIKPETADENLPTENKSDKLLIDLYAAFNNRDTDLFLLNADRAINRINTSKLRDAEPDKYKRFKDSIYNCRYGGGSFTDEEMKELIEWFKKYLSA